MEFYKLDIEDNRINLDLKEQSEKIQEELKELLNEVNKSMDNSLSYVEELTIINCMYAESFDIIQSVITFLSILEKCTCTDLSRTHKKNIIESRYMEHVEKLLDRKWKLDRL